MKPPILLRVLQQIYPQTSRDSNSHVGFTIVEILLIVAILGILSAIAAPAWNAFITKQRIRTVNGQVLQALQKAQSEAKSKKANITVEFRDVNMDNEIDPGTGKPYNDPPRFHIHPASATTPIPNNDIFWDSMGANGEIKAGMVKLVSGLCTDEPCTAIVPNSDTFITFDYQGMIEDDYVPFAVTVSTPDNGLKRCVIVQTILGGMRTAEGTNCP